MSDKKYIAVEKDEKDALTEFISQEFGENRIAQGAAIRLLAEEKLSDD